MNLELRVNSFITGTNSDNTYSLPTLWEVEGVDKESRNTPEAQVGERQAVQCLPRLKGEE